MATRNSLSAVVVAFNLFLAVLAAQGAQVTFTRAEQQVVGHLAAKLSDEDSDHVIDEQLDPATPKGLGNANLRASVGGSGASGDANLVSIFGANELTVKGSTAGDTEWIGEPPDAWDVHVGGGSIFVLDFKTGDSATPFRIDGSIGVELIGEPDRHPEETFVDVKLSLGAGAVLWHTSLDGAAGSHQHEVNYERVLEPLASYRLEIRAQMGSVATLDRPGPQSRRAWFDLHPLWLGEPNEPAPPAPVSPTDCDLVGPWIGRLSSPTEALLHTFTFSPLCPGADEYLMTVQTTKLAAAAREAFPKVNHLTSLVGKAVPSAGDRFQFTAIGYGSQLDCTCDQPTYIAIMSGTLKPSNDGKTLAATASVSYYPGEQDLDLDGFPDTSNDMLCLTYEGTLKAVGLREPCQ